VIDPRATVGVLAALFSSQDTRARFRKFKSHGKSPIYSLMSKVFRIVYPDESEVPGVEMVLTLVGLK